MGKGLMFFKKFILIIMVSVNSFSCGRNSGPGNLGIKEGMIDVPGGKVWYKIVGLGKKGTPLLTLHGGPGAPHDYLETLEALSDERPVIFYDQLGCGESDTPSDTSLWNVNRFVKELEMVRKALGLKKVHILGQSWGSMLAVEYLLRKKPDGVVSLILSAPYLCTETWKTDQQSWISQLPEDVRDTIRSCEEKEEYVSPAYQEAMMTFYKKHLCRMDPWPECLNRTMEKMGTGVYEYMWGPSEFTITGTLKNADLTGRLEELDIPVLFTCGEYDEATPSATRLYQSKIKGSKMYEFKGASHSHHLEKPEEYIKVIREFITNTE
jgi:proline iminopeptidase